MKQLRYTLTGVFYVAVLAAFCYGASGCASAPVEKDPCPPSTDARLQATFKIYNCTGDNCEMVMTTCVVSPDGKTWPPPADVMEGTFGGISPR